jgi:diamine N-acetyltransferase
MKGSQVFLRALEPSDIDVLYRMENDPQTWSVSDTLAPFSKHVLEQYLQNAHLDIFTVKQFRFMIVENSSNQAVGTIDLFDFDPYHQRIAVGVLIDSEFRRKGYASEALSLLEDYCFNILQVHQIYAHIAKENSESVSLFEKHQFERTGVKKEWRKTIQGWSDELIYQKISKQ